MHSTRTSWSLTPKLLAATALVFLTALSAGLPASAQQKKAPPQDLPETSGAAQKGQAPPLLPQEGGAASGLQPTEDLIVPFPFGGRDRLYRLHVPRGYDAKGKPVPLILVLHGAFGSAAKIAKKSGFSELSEKVGFLVAYPQGTSLARTWNSGHCCGRSYKQQVDDVGFLSAVMKEIQGKYAVDPNRIFMVGESNGGMMTYRYAAERTNDLAGIGVVAGTIGGQKPDGSGEWRVPTPQAPIALVAIHGTEDKKIPYGGEGGKTVSALDSVRFFIENNQCAAKPQEADRFFGGYVLREWWAGCSLSSNVVMLTLEGFGHDWPNEKTAKSLGQDGGRGFDSATLIWQYLRSKRRWRKIDMTPAQPAGKPAPKPSEKG